MNYKRDIYETFKLYNESFKAILLTGPRQVGKTTFLLDNKESFRKYVTLDDLEIRKFANENPKEFIKKYSPPVIIDEIQYAPSLMSYIKIICDNTKEKGLFWTYVKFLDTFLWTIFNFCSVFKFIPIPLLTFGSGYCVKEPLANGLHYVTFFLHK